MGDALYELAAQKETPTTLRMVQAIDNGFQKPKMERSVLVLLDFSAAFDTVWRQKLLLYMLDTGVPHAYVKWLFQFLNNRQARIKFNSSIKASPRLCSVTAPVHILH